MQKFYFTIINSFKMKCISKEEKLGRETYSILMKILLWNKGPNNKRKSKTGKCQGGKQYCQCTSTILQKCLL